MGSRNRTKRDKSAVGVKNAEKPIWTQSRFAVPKLSIGYVRVSKTSQTVQQQTDALQSGRGGHLWRPGDTGF